MIIEFPSKLDAAWLEEAAARCDAQPEGPVVLNLRRWNETHGLAEGRLLQWMRRLGDSGRRVELNLGQTMPELAEDPRHTLWKLFKNELGAVIAVDAAAEVLDSEQRDRREEIVEVQREVLSASGGEVGSGSERALLRFDRFDSPRCFRAFVDEVEGFSLIHGRIGQLIDDALNLTVFSAKQLDQLSNFLFEVIDNTRRHACDDLAGDEIGGVRFAHVRRLKVTRQRPMERLMTSGDHLQDYLERLASLGGPAGESIADFIELTIADSGVGIPARLLGSMDVYGDPLAAETELTLKATRLGTSSLPKTAVRRGEGLDTAIEMTDRLRGLLVVRTGRLELIRDTTFPAASGQDGWHIVERTYLPGTSISLLLPWWEGAQEKLEATTR